MALFRHRDTGSIFPSVERVGYLLGHPSRRWTQRLLQQLRDLGILVPQQDTRGGRGRTIRYSFDASALPERPPFKRRRENRGVQTAVSAEGNGGVQSAVYAPEKGGVQDQKGGVQIQKGGVQIPKGRRVRRRISKEISKERSVKRDTNQLEVVPPAVLVPTSKNITPLRGNFSDEDEDENPEGDAMPDDPTTTPLRDPGRPLSDDELLRRRRNEWRGKSDANPIDVTNLRADAERIAAEARRRKTGSDDER
jgi:hypothetical protein